MTYFIMLIVPYLFGAALIAMGLRVSPYLVTIGLILILASWIFG